MAPDDALSHAVAAKLVSLDSRVRVCEWAEASDHAMLPSVGASGFTLEVGPVAWGVVDGELYATTLRLVLAALDAVHERNAALVSRSAGGVENSCIERASREFPAVSPMWSRYDQCCGESHARHLDARSSSRDTVTKSRHSVTLDALHKAAASPRFDRTELPVFRTLRRVDYPRDECGELQALVHPKQDTPASNHARSSLQISRRDA